MIFSFVIPIFNIIENLDVLLENIKTLQKIPDFEILIIDDCSNDGSYEYLINHHNNNNKIRFYKTSINKGPGTSRNIGISKARGRYIIFIDADDSIKINDNFSNNPEFLSIKNGSIIDVIGFNTFIETRKADIRLPLPLITSDTKKIDIDLCLNDKTFPAVECWGWIFSIDFLRSEKIYFPDIRIGEDEVFMSLVKLKLKNIKFTNIFKYHKIANYGSLSNIYGEIRLYSYKIVIEKLVEFQKNYPGPRSIFLRKKLTEIIDQYYWLLLSSFDSNMCRENKSYYNLVQNLNIVELSPIKTFEDFLTFRKSMKNFIIENNDNGLVLYCFSKIANSIASYSKSINKNIYAIIDDAKYKNKQNEQTTKFGPILLDKVSQDCKNKKFIICHERIDIVLKLSKFLEEVCKIKKNKIFYINKFGNVPNLVENLE